MRVLVVAAHPDDEVLGAGATIAKHTLAGDSVTILILGRGRPSAEVSMGSFQAAKILGAVAALEDLPDNQFDTVPLLSIVQSVERAVQKYGPEVVYTHSADDLNIDHRRVHEAVLSASRPQSGCSVRRILAFEVPSSTEWGLAEFWPNVFMDVSGDPINLKRQALKCYASEMRLPPHPRSYEAIDALAMWRGASAGVSFAEAFKLIREIE